MIRNSILIIFIFLICGCRFSSKATQNKSTPRLHFLDQYIIPFQFQFDSTSVGGLSGIDYDPVSKRFFSISDDRSDINPARFYTYRLQIKNDRIDTLIFLKKIFLKNKSGNFFPSSAREKFGSVDPEALRIDPWTNNFVWTSEGERIITAKDTVLENPKIFISDSLGNYIDTFQLPDQLRMSYLEKGTRRNGGFEGFTYSGDGKYLFASVEEPLRQDDSRAGPGDSSATVRIIKYDLKTKKPLAQFAYEIDPVAYAPVPLSAFKVNGISDILWVGNDRLLIIERSYSTGRLSCTIKIFLADLENAQDVSSFESLKGKKIRKVKKQLLLNMDSLGIFIDNIEGVTFGPQLSNGHQSLIFVADNNFNPLAKNQYLLFEITGL